MSTRTNKLSMSGGKKMPKSRQVLIQTKKVSQMKKKGRKQPGSLYWVYWYLITDEYEK